MTQPKYNNTQGNSVWTTTTATGPNLWFDEYKIINDHIYQVNPDAIKTPEDMMNVFKIILEKSMLQIRFHKEDIEGFEKYIKVKEEDIDNFTATEIARLKLSGVTIERTQPETT